MSGLKLTPNEWEVVAYEAALRDDDDAIVASLRELNEFGVECIERALHGWMERTGYVLKALSALSSEPVALALEMHSCDDGPAQIDPQVAWGAQLFAAHAAQDQAAWKTLFSAVPAGPDLDELVVMTLKMLTQAAASADDAAAEALPAAAAAGALKPDSHIPPMIRAARMARAQLN